MRASSGSAHTKARSSNWGCEGKMRYARARLFRVKGVPVYAHITWILSAAGFIAGAGYEKKSLRGALLAGVLLLMLFGSALFHECSHALAARALRYLWR